MLLFVRAFEWYGIECRIFDNSTPNLKFTDLIHSQLIAHQLETGAACEDGGVHILHALRSIIFFGCFMIIEHMTR